mgnify:CR=1 FL=1
MCYNSKYIKKSLIPLFKTQRSDYQERNTSVKSSAQQRLNKKRRSFYRSPGLLLIFLCGLALIHLLTLSGLIRPEILWDKTTVDTRSLLLAGIFTILILAAMIWSIRFRVIPALRAGRLGTGAENPVRRNFGLFCPSARRLHLRISRDIQNRRRDHLHDRTDRLDQMRFGDLSGPQKTACPLGFTYYTVFKKIKLGRPSRSSFFTLFLPDDSHFSPQKTRARQFCCLTLI